MLVASSVSDTYQEAMTCVLDVADNNYEKLRLNTYRTNTYFNKMKAKEELVKKGAQTFFQSSDKPFIIVYNNSSQMPRDYDELCEAFDDLFDKVALELGIQIPEDDVEDDIEDEEDHSSSST